MTGPATPSSRENLLTADRSAPCAARNGGRVGAFTGKDAGNGGVSAPKQIFCLGAVFYDPTGKDASKRFLVLSVAAIWCVPCKVEANELPAKKVKYGPQGVIFMTDLAENNSKERSTDADLDLWISNGQTTLIVNDADFVLRNFFDRNSMPLNMIIDLKTMKIVRKMVGNADDNFWGKLDGFLAGK